MNDPQRKTGSSTFPTAQEKKGPPVVFIAGFIIVVVVLFLVGVLPRIQENKELHQMHDETVGAVPVVHTIMAKPASKTESLTLPGNIGAILYTTIYARVDGYLKQRCVDIGDVVKKGQLLGEIDTPTIDEKLNQAQADLDEAKATLLSTQAQYKEAVAKEEQAKAEVAKGKSNVAYASVTADRWQDLVTRGAVSVQSKDEKVRMLNSTSAQLMSDEANVRVQQATVKAAASQIQVARAGVAAKLANVRRLEAELNFKNVVAPFDGVITARKVDPGALITEGSQTSSLELFQMAKIDRLRIYVSVPQRVARYLRTGMVADVTVQEYPDRLFKGTVTNVSGALDPNTRTRQTEIQIDNPDQALLPGMYGEVKLQALRDTPWIQVPGTTVVTRPDGMYVVAVENGKAHYQRITLGRDFGDQIEVRTGVKDQQQVVISPSDDLRDGDAVQAELVKSEPM
jgi:RND family efflux transporter MFP subunit